MELYVKTPTGGYNVLIRRGATEQSETYSGIPRGGKTLIVTDDGVPERYIKTIASRCARFNYAAAGRKQQKP